MPGVRVSLCGPRMGREMRGVVPGTQELSRFYKILIFYVLRLYSKIKAK